MSQIKTAVALTDTQVQFVSTSADGRNRVDANMIPLTADGTAVRTAAGGSIAASITTVLSAVVPSSGTYTDSTPTMDLLGYNSVSVVYKVSKLESGKFAYLKPRWSVDGTNFYDEPVEIAGASSGTDAAGTLLYTVTLGGRVIKLALDTLNQGKIERYNRLARYLKFAYAGDATATTGATITVTARPLNN